MNRLRVLAVAAFAAILTSCLVETAAAGPIPARAFQPDPRSLYLRAGTIDLRTIPTLLAPGASFSPNSRYVVQLDGPITPARRSALQDAGVVLGDYLPMYAYIANMGAARADALIELGFVAWVGTYQDNWKFCPKIAGRRVFQTTRRRALAAAGKRRLIAHLFRGADSQKAARRLEQCGGAVCDATRTGNRKNRKDRPRLELDIAEANLAALRGLDEVMFVEEAPEAAPRNTTTSWICQSNVLDFTPLWDQGLHGENQIVGLIDWDLDENHCAFFDANPFGPTHRKILAYYGWNQNANFGWHGTHVAGILCGYDPAESNPNLNSMAYASKLVFHDQAATITSTNLNDRLVIAHGDGARVHSNSWGANIDDSYNAWARDIDLFSRNNEDDLVIFAIINGNAGNSILSPENAKNCLAVGACQDTPNQELHGSGGIGPTTDGRQKPEVWVPGCGTHSANFGTACGVVLRSCATSYAAPAASGMAVLVRQYFTDGFFPSGAAAPQDVVTPSGALIKAILINSAVDMSGFAGYFGPHEGWGRILVDDALFFSGDGRKLVIEDIRNAAGLSTGESDVFYVDAASNTEPLKISLIWTDVPGTIGVALTPSNNLDLVVTDPLDNVYLGNVFSGAESTTGGTADALNNGEQVHRNTPTPGIWKVEVLGTAVNQDTQGFALVVTGDAECLKGDVNKDGLLNGEDVAAFVSVILNGGTLFQACAADMNGTSGPGMDDLAAFVAALLAAGP